MKVKKGKQYYYGKDSRIWTCVDAIDGEDKQSSFISELGQDAKFYNHDMYYKRYRRVSSTIVATLPKGTFNIGISTSSVLYGDSNDSSNWWRVAVPLPRPKGEWEIIREIATDDGISLTLADKY